MSNEYNKNLFGRLTKLFRSGPVVRRRVKGMTQKTGTASTALEVFRSAHSDVYNSTLSAYGAFDRMCVSLDTKIPIPGPEKYLTMGELIERYSDGEKFIVYAYDAEKGEITPAWAHHPRSSGVRKTVRITFDDGSHLICTPDHPCMMRDGTFRDAGELSPGDSMMPFYRKDFQGHGYYNIYTTKRSENSWNGWRAEHHLIAEWSSNRRVKKGIEHVHHIDFNPSNNRPENLAIMDAKEHLSYHARLSNHNRGDDYRAYMSRLKKQAWENNDRQGGEWRENLTQFNKRSEVREMRRQHMLLNNPSKQKEVAEKISQKQTERYKNPDERAKASARAKELHELGKVQVSEAFSSYWKGRRRSDEWKQARTGKNHHGWVDIDIKALIALMVELKQRKLVAEAMHLSPATVGRRAQSILGGENWEENVRRAQFYNTQNHRVVSVEPWVTIETGDLTVDGYENFATDTIIVHNSRYSDFSEMEATPEIASALDIYAEETVSQGTDGRILHIHSDNRKIQELLESLFYDTVNVEFNLVMWVRNLVKYGDFFLFNDISPDYGVLNCIPISISEIEREEGFDPSDPMAVRYRWITQGNQVLENWQVTHFRLLGNDAFLPYGSSVLEGARRIWRQLILIEDAMLVYRVIRAPERRVFYIDVGNVPPEEISNYLEQAQSSLKRNEVVDRNTGKVDLRFNPMAVDQDYFLPVRGGESGTKIDTLAGGQNTAAIEDVQYIQKKLFAALKIPKAYLGYDEETGAKATLAQEDIRFSRSIQRIQKTVLAELNKLAMIHLYAHGYEGDDLMDFSLKLSNPSSIAQQQKLELISTKFDIAGKAPEGLVSRRWIRKNILELTDQEIELLKEEREDDKLEDAAVEKAGSEEAPEGGEAGGEAGGAEGGEEGGEEGGLGDLFAGDEPQGDLLVATSPKGKGNDEDEDDEEEEFKLPSIDDPDAPIKISNRIERTSSRMNMFGEPLKKSRKQTRGPASTGLHDFASMTGLGNTQSTLRDPYQKNWLKNPLGVGEAARGEAEAERVISSMQRSTKFARPKILREAGSENSREEDLELDVDLDSLGSEFDK